MIYFVIFCLFTALTMYLLLGGADFGAGILELFSPRAKRKHLQHVTYKAIGPIWEANHIWLILAVVILFVGFPSIHALMVTHLHIPLTLVLIGIIFRGTAFVFKHYDAVRDESQSIYDRIFMYSSMLTPLFLGIAAGAVLGGRVDPNATDFYGAFVAPWLNPFAFSVGLFTVSICAFLAAVYLIGENDDPNHVTRFTTKAKWANIAVVGSGGLVLLFGSSEWRSDFVLGLGGLGLAVAAVAVVLLWTALGKKRFGWARVVAAGQVVAVLAAVGGHGFPSLAPGVDFMDAAAGEGTIRGLGWALVGGLALIGPALAFLFKVFKTAEAPGK